MSEGTSQLILEELRLFRTRTEDNISSLHQKIDDVHTQTVKTNGRVNRLEDRQKECPGKDAMTYIKENKLRYSKPYQIGQLVLLIIGCVGAIELVKTII